MQIIYYWCGDTNNFVSSVWQNLFFTLGLKHAIFNKIILNKIFYINASKMSMQLCMTFIVQRSITSQYLSYSLYYAALVETFMSSSC